MNIYELTNAENLFAIAKELHENWSGFADIQRGDERYHIEVRLMT